MRKNIKTIIAGVGLVATAMSLSACSMLSKKADSNQTAKPKATQTQSSNSNTQSNLGVNKKGYDAIKISAAHGNTVKEVKEIIGKEPTETRKSHGTTELTWEGVDGGDEDLSYMTVEFSRDGLATKKRITGLQPKRDKITDAQYKKIKKGMSYDEVYKILGEANEYSHDYEEDEDMTGLGYKDKLGGNKEIDYDFTFFNNKLFDKDKMKL